MDGLCSKEVEYESIFEGFDDRTFNLNIVDNLGMKKEDLTFRISSKLCNRSEIPEETHSTRNPDNL